MFRVRFTTWTLLACAGFALAAPPAFGQDPPIPKKNEAAFRTVREYYEQQRGGIPPEKLKEAREAFASFAKYYADVIAHPLVWKASLDPSLPVPATLPIIEDRPPGRDGVLHELDRFLLIPVVGGTKVGPDQIDYIREFGAAMDAALKNLMDTHPEIIVRVNAARVLAHIARSGAPAHFATVTSMIANANTPTAVKVYLFHAAGALLAAGDPEDPKVRKHTGDPKAVGALIKALDDCITTPSKMVVGLPAKADAIAPDQLAVIGMVRRQAVRALARTKFAAFPGPDGKLLYPSYTLVRIAMGDPALTPIPGSAECAEAVIGLCNMAPVIDQNGRMVAIKGYNADVAVEAMLTGLVTFAGPRAANRDDHSLPWRSYAVRIAESMRNGRPLFDPNYEIAQPTQYDTKLIPPLYEEMYKEVVPNILAPMDKVDSSGKPDVGATVKIESLRKRLADLSARPNRKTELFAGVPQTSIKFAAPK